MKKQFVELKKKYGTHTKVANLLGITPRHYVRIRDGSTPPKKSIQFMIDHLLVNNGQDINGK
jgi:hypothetical protein